MHNIVQLEIQRNVDDIIDNNKELLEENPFDILVKIIDYLKDNNYIDGNISYTNYMNELTDCPIYYLNAHIIIENGTLAFGSIDPIYVINIKSFQDYLRKYIISTGTHFGKEKLQLDKMVKDRNKIITKIVKQLNTGFNWNINSVSDEEDVYNILMLIYNGISINIEFDTGRIIDNLIKIN